MTDWDDVLNKAQRFNEEHEPEKREERIRREARKKYKELVPDLTPIDKSQQDKDIDDALDRLSVVEAYKRWCPKAGTFEIRDNRREVKIRCPIPGHEDTKPSASINTEKNVWDCYACEQGGDSYDLAAWHFGYQVPGYKESAAFRDLREDMAADLGLSISNDGSAHPPTPVPQSQSAEDEESPTTHPSAESAPAQPDDDPLSLELGDIDYSKVAIPGTFLFNYMKEATKDDLPTNFHLFNGYMTLALANGRHINLEAGAWPVDGRLYAILYGPTGSGKTQTWRIAERILEGALPFNEDPGLNEGVLVVTNPVSSEGIYDSFTKIDDNLDKEDPDYIQPVNGIIAAEEFSTILTRRQGGDLRPALTELFDSSGPRTRVRAKSSGGITKFDAFPCMITGTQPRAIKKLLEQADADSGFLNRYLFVPANGGGTTDSPIDLVRHDLDDLIERLRKLNEWCRRNASTLEMTEDAKDVYRDWYDREFRPVYDEDDMSRAFLVRLPFHMLKLILLTAVNEECDVVESELVERVLTMAPVLMAAYAMAESDIKAHDDDIIIETAVKRTEELARKNGVWPTPADVKKSTRSLKGNKVPMGTWKRCLEIAYGTGELRLEKIMAGSGGRPRFQLVVPSLADVEIDEE